MRFVLVQKITLPDRLYRRLTGIQGFCKSKYIITVHLMVWRRVP